MSDGEALLHAILMQPDEDTPRLACADWLDERGKHARAELIRVQCEIARILAAELDGPARERKRQLREREADLTHVIRGPLFGRGGELLPACLLYAVHHGRHGAEEIFGTGFGCRRGFPFRWRCSLREFLRDAPVAFAALPIEMVELVDREPLGSPGFGRVAWLADDTNLAGATECCRLGPLFDWVPRTPGVAENLRVYESWELAHAALSVGCVAYGRSAVGLPRLKESRK